VQDSARAQWVLSAVDTVAQRIPDLGSRAQAFPLRGVSLRERAVGRWGKGADLEHPELLLEQRQQRPHRAASELFKSAT